MNSNVNGWRALITGITGQDGAYLAMLLLEKGYTVFGAYRRTSSVNFWRLEELGLMNHERLELVELDVTDPGACVRVVQSTKVSEIYNLAAQSFVGVSFEQPSTTAQITGLGPLNLLEAIRIIDPRIKFYQASTSEMFGKVQQVPQVETTMFYPRSPYGAAKLYAHWITVNYRESYGLFAASGILFNHESPLRGIEFVTRKITDGMASIKLGLKNSIELGNLDAKRDWGHAKDYVEGMWRMLQAKSPETFILATNRTNTVREFVTMAASAVDINIEWRGSGLDEKGFNAETGDILVTINERFYRPAEVDLLIGNPQKAADKLDWRPSVTLEELCGEMVAADLSRKKMIC